MRAIAKQPADRYPTADDLHADLQRYTHGSPVLALAGYPAEALATEAMTIGSPEATRALGGGAPTVVLPTGAATTAMPSTVQQRSELAGGMPGAPEMPKRRWVGWTIAGVVLAAALALLVFFGGRSLGYFGAPGFMSMPDVRGEGVHAATTQLRRDGLKVNAVAVYSTVRKGQVLKEDPAADATVRKGSTVRLVYSGGRRLVTVPPVANEQYTAAEKALKARGLHYTLIPVTPTPGAVEGIVTKTSPAGGQRVLPGSAIEIYYIHGVARVKVPSVSGDTVQQADTAIVSSHLTLGADTYAPSATVPKGKVAGTNPPAGNVLPEGSSVSLVISQGPPVAVPPVTDDPAAEAESLIESAGLVPSVTYVPGLPSNAGYVTSQNPPAGTEVAKGSTVTIDVVKATTPTTTSTTSTTSTTNPGPFSSGERTTSRPSTAVRSPPSAVAGTAEASRSRRDRRSI